MTSPMLEIVADDNNRCGEAPIWDAAQKRLIWTDISGDLVYEYRPSENKKTILSRRLNVSGIALNETGELILAGATGLHLWRGQDDYRTILSEHDGEKLNFNDIIAGPGGQIYAGTLYWNEIGMQKPGKLYLVNPDGTLRVVDDGIELANGLAFSVDGRTLYFADSAARRIYSYSTDPKTGELSRRKTFVQVPAEDGIPDGLTVDSEDRVWCAMWYGGQVVRYDPAGQVEWRVALPVKQVSSVAFGGENMSDLYITTAGEAWPSDLVPPGFRFDGSAMGGALYRVRLNSPGKVEYRARLK